MRAPRRAWRWAMAAIDPILDADLLYVLSAMGQGDTPCVVDANYPAATTLTTLSISAEN